MATMATTDSERVMQDVQTLVEDFQTTEGKLLETETRLSLCCSAQKRVTDRMAELVRSLASADGVKTGTAQRVQSQLREAADSMQTILQYLNESGCALNDAADHATGDTATVITESDEAAADADYSDDTADNGGNIEPPAVAEPSEQVDDALDEVVTDMHDKIDSEDNTDDASVIAAQMADMEAQAAQAAQEAEEAAERARMAEADMFAAQERAAAIHKLEADAADAIQRHEEEQERARARAASVASAAVADVHARAIDRANDAGDKVQKPLQPLQPLTDMNLFEGLPPLRGHVALMKGKLLAQSLFPSDEGLDLAERFVGYYKRKVAENGGRDLTLAELERAVAESKAALAAMASPKPRGSPSPHKSYMDQGDYAGMIKLRMMRGGASKSPTHSKPPRSHTPSRRGAASPTRGSRGRATASGAAASGAGGAPAAPSTALQHALVEVKRDISSAVLVGQKLRGKQRASALQRLLQYGMQTESHLHKQFPSERRVVTAKLRDYVRSAMDLLAA